MIVSERKMYYCGCECVCIMTVRYVGVIGYHGVRLAQGLGDSFRVCSF